MKEVIIGALGACGGGVLTLLVVTLVNTLRTSSSLPRRVTRLEGAVVTLIEVNDRQTDGIIASLEAQRDGRCNGNVSKALERLCEAKDKSGAFLAAQAVGEGRK